VHPKVNEGSADVRDGYTVCSQFRRSIENESIISPHHEKNLETKALDTSRT
jgi:hypothetical protein